MKVFCHVHTEDSFNHPMVMVEKEFVARPMVDDYVLVSDDFERIKESWTKSELENAKKIYYDWVYSKDELTFVDAMIVKSVSFVPNKETNEMELHIEVGR